jgi:hypothetical protein
MFLCEGCIFHMRLLSCRKNKRKDDGSIKCFEISIPLW